MPNDTCSVAGCDLPVKRAQLCYGHYMRNWRYGSPTFEHAPRFVDMVGQRFGTLTVGSRHGRVWFCRCDCGMTRIASAGELNRTGDGNTCGTPGRHLSPEAGYGAAHDRVRTLHGPASDHPCIDCGQPAQHWSYDHTDPDTRYLTGRSANPIPYSLDPTRYQPRCVPCHKLFDLARAKAS